MWPLHARKFVSQQTRIKFQNVCIFFVVVIHHSHSSQSHTLHSYGNAAMIRQCLRNKHVTLRRHVK